MTTTATAGMPLPVLVGKLARAGWGDLERCEQLVLRALVDVLPHRSAEGKSTAGQLADVAGYSEKWVRQALVRLVDKGLLEWHRGGVVNGKPTPSFFRVIKRALIALLPGALVDQAQRQAQRATATAARVAGLGTVPTRRPGSRPGRPLPPRFRSSVHAEVATSPDPYREVTGPAATSGAGMPTDPSIIKEMRMQLRNARRRFFDS